MKTKNLFRILIGSIFMVAASSAFGQSSPYLQMTAAPNTIDSVTAGVAIPFFVMPDPILNDAFLGIYAPASTNVVNNLESSWTWLKGATTPAGTVITQAIANAPYVTINFVDNAAAHDTILVYETSKAPAGCVGDTSMVIVSVVPAPSFIVSNNALTDTVYYCDGIAPQDLSLDAVTNNGVAGGFLKLRFDYRIANLNSAQTAISVTIKSTNDTIVSIPLSNGVNVDLLALYPFEAINGEITEYVFAFDNTLSAATQNGISDRISRKSNFLALTDKTGATNTEYTYYAATASINSHKVVRVFPKPNTGTIYFIPNNFNN